MTAGELFFSTEGRIPRSGYWGASIVLAIVAVVAMLVLWGIFGRVGLILTPGGRFAQFLVTMMLVYPAYCIAAKRFQDHEYSGSLAMVGIGATVLKAMLDWFHVTGDPWVPNGLDTLFMIVQIGIGIWYFILLGCMRGTDGKNQYGPAPI